MSCFTLSRPELEREVVDALRELHHHSSFGRDALFETREIAETVYGGPVRPNAHAWRRVCARLRALARRGEVEQDGWVEQDGSMGGLWGLP
jgi:hypothetical protein